MGENFTYQVQYIILEYFFWSLGDLKTELHFLKIQKLKSRGHRIHDFDPENSPFIIILKKIHSLKNKGPFTNYFYKRRGVGGQKIDFL